MTWAHGQREFFRGTVRPASKPFHIFGTGRPKRHAAERHGGVIGCSRKWRGLWIRGLFLKTRVLEIFLERL
ncbi:hypothetical protein EDC27_1318 [Desulfosoma caldarium]|uniref:Uncharacterized protein n=1 Tax=Desulfosoma caldarium TaxID=610254 RepID=A0A3N1UQA2_9BACT|nr:hypothetical protein EDC27_1318 [Desulfosoma caldarium]